MSGYCLEIGTDFVTITCYKSNCGFTFAVPREWNKDRLRDQKIFHCPNGHAQSYCGKTPEQKLKERLQRQERITESISNQRDVERNRRKFTERQLAAQKGVVTKIKKRQAHGVCPCCMRTFKQLSRHMKNKHPDFVAENK